MASQEEKVLFTEEDFEKYMNADPSDAEADAADPETESVQTTQELLWDVNEGGPREPKRGPGVTSTRGVISTGRGGDDSSSGDDSGVPSGVPRGFLLGSLGVRI